MRNANYGFLTDRGRKEALEWFTKRDQCFLYFLYSALQWFFFIKGTNTKSMWTYNTPKVLCSRDFFWNFTSQSRVIFISLSLLNLDFQSSLFHFHFSKRVKFDTNFYNKINHSWRVQKPKHSMSGIIFEFSRNFTSRSRSFFISFSLLDPKSIFFTCTSRVNGIFISLCTSREKWKIFVFTFHVSIVQNPLWYICNSAKLWRHSHFLAGYEQICPTASD